MHAGYLKRMILLSMTGLVATCFLMGTYAFSQEILKIGGVGSALGTMKIMGEAFEKTHPEIKVDVLPSLGSAGAVKAVSKGAISIGLLGRPMKETEKETGLIVSEYASTPFIFVVHPEIDVSNISTAEIVKIYRGEMTTWQDGSRIRLILRPKGDSDTLIAQSISSEVRDAIDIALTWPGMLFPLTDQESADVTERTPGALGFSTLTQIIAEKRSLKALSLDGVAPTVKTLADGTYRYFKLLFLAVKPDSHVSVKKFIDFVRSPEGNIILEETGNMVISD